MFTESSREVVDGGFFLSSFSILDVANKSWVFQISSSKSDREEEKKNKKDSFFGTCRVSLYLVHTN